MPNWIRWAMPSIADLVFVCVLGTLIFTPLSVRLLGDAGTGWHIRTGQLILSTQAIPQVDPFSSTMAGKPWFAWEWLYDLVVGWFDNVAGLNGVAWLAAVTIGAVFVGLFRLLLVRGTHLVAAVILVLLALSASTVHFLARPHLLSWLFTLAWFWILDSTEVHRTLVAPRKQAYRLWMLPVLMLVWVNVHGGFLLGFMLLAIFWLGSVWTAVSLKSSRIEESLEKIRATRRSWQLFWIALASAVASLCNPYGWKLHEHVLSYLSNRFLMDHIEEFQSPNFHGLAQRCFLVLLVICLAVCIVRGRRLRLAEIFIVLFALYAGLYATRNIPVSSILLVMVVGPLIPAAGISTDFFRRMADLETRMSGHLWPGIAIVATLSMAVHGGQVRSTEWMDAHFDPKRMPVGAATFLGTLPGPGPILGPDYWGGYVIYRLYPDKKVVIDDRHDMYGAPFLQSYLRMVHVEKGWEEFLQQTSPAYLLLPRNTALATIMSKTWGWRSIYADETAVVFARDRKGH